MKLKPVDWVKKKGRKNVRVYCDRCTEEFVARLPMGVSCFAALVKTFIREHRRCRPKGERS